MKLVLASTSPRRHELLKLLLDDFVIQPSTFDEESCPATLPLMYVKECALGKAQMVADVLGDDELVLGADTIVVCAGEIFGKPKDVSDAERMLKRLRGNTHQVIGGIALCTADGRLNLVESVSSDVSMRQITDAEITEYIAGGEPMDKAGAYAIQGEAAKFINYWEGDYYNIVGLSLAMVEKMFKTAGMVCKELPPPVDRIESSGIIINRKR